MRLAILSLLTALLAGCAGFGARQADRYYVLEPESGPTASSLRDCATDVLPTTAASFYDTQDIVFSRAAGTRGYYQFNHWTERPQRVIYAQLAARCRDDGRRDIYKLVTHLNEFYHDAVNPPGSSRITITAELVEAGNRSVVARRTFSRSAPATSYDAAGAVRGFNEALEGLLEDVGAWVGTEIATRQLHSPAGGGAPWIEGHAERGAP
jgi:ABC-type uncharacterized transport system auxiliary subunit